MVKKERTELAASEGRNLQESVRFEQLKGPKVRAIRICAASNTYSSPVYRVPAEAIRVGVRFGVGGRISPDSSMDTFEMSMSTSL